MSQPSPHQGRTGAGGCPAFEHNESWKWLVMPYKPKRPCNHPGCPALTTERFCETHAKQYRQQQDRERGTAHERGYTARWRRAREWFLKQNPLCVECQKRGKLTPATVVDHIIPHKGDMESFWNVNNWQALCKPCHDRKTAREDGGFGRDG